MASGNSFTRGDFMIRLLRGWAQQRGIPLGQINESLTSDTPFVLRPDQLVDLIWFVCEGHLAHKARLAANQAPAIPDSNGVH